MMLIIGMYIKYDCADYLFFIYFFFQVRHYSISKSNDNKVTGLQQRITKRQQDIFAKQKQYCVNGNLYHTPHGFYLQTLYSTYTVVLVYKYS